jgi:ABC-2 type transport system ATP-binding protein
MAADSVLVANRLSKSYGDVRAVRDVSFEIARGEIVGFLGPNGAGKSTTLRMLAGFLGATSGTVRVDGHDVTEEPLRARAAIGYMPETAPLYPEMRVSEYLAFRAELKGLRRAARKDAVARSLRDANVEHFAEVMIGHLSKGYRQRVGLADALLGSPPLLILDEPTAGLDPNQIREVRALIRRIGEERTVLLSTHILPEVEATCTRALVIARGRLVAEGSIEEIRAMRRSTGVRVVVRGSADKAKDAASKVEGVSGARAATTGGAVELTVDLVASADAAATTEALVAALVKAGLGIREVGARTASLEQVFAELTRSDVATLQASPAPEPEVPDGGDGPEEAA